VRSTIRVTCRTRHRAGRGEEILLKLKVSSIQFELKVSREELGVLEEEFLKELKEEERRGGEKFARQKEK